MNLPLHIIDVELGKIEVLRPDMTQEEIDRINEETQAKINAVEGKI